jgi:Ni,Fe-hydrogenase I large subunit
MATPIDPNSQNAINANTIAQLLEYADRAQAFVDKVYIPDLLAIASFYKDWAGIGAGVGNFLSYGEFQNDNLPNTTNVWLPAGFIKGKDLTKIEKVDHKKMTEEVSRSWYKYAGGDDKPLHPWDGETTPNYTGPKETYKELNTDGKNKYSWVKAIRYDGVPVEVGPLARMVIAYAAGTRKPRDSSTLSSANWASVLRHSSRHSDARLPGVLKQN